MQLGNCGRCALAPLRSYAACCLVDTAAWRCGRCKAVEAFCWPHWTFGARDLPLCGRVRAVGAIRGRWRDCGFSAIWRGSGAGRVPRPCTLHTLKTANPARQRPSAAIRRPPLPWNGHTAMPRCPPGQHAAWLRRGARAHRPQPPSCKPHSARRPRPRQRYWSVGNRGRHAPTAHYHRLLGLALQAHCRLCHGNRSETAVEGRVRVQRGQIGQNSHDSRPHRAQPRAA